MIFLTIETFGQKKGRFGILMAVISMILGISQTDFNLIPINTTMMDGYNQVKVFNWNTNCWDQHKNRSSFYHFLKKQKADIYILQEYLHGTLNWSDPKVDTSGEHIDKSKLFRICSVVPGFPIHYLAIDDSKRIRLEFPGYHLAIHQQFVIISRFPIGNSDADYSEQFSVADIRLFNRMVRFFNVHILLHVEPENPLQPYFYEALQRRFKARQLALTDLKQTIHKTATDYFLSGDFNATKAMGVMNDLLAFHFDSFNYSREWIPLTFSFGGLKLWRFDYQMVPKSRPGLRFISCQNINPGGLSDHTAQVIWLGVKKGEN